MYLSFMCISGLIFGLRVCVCTHIAVGIPSACPTSQTAHIA